MASYLIGSAIAYFTGGDGDQNATITPSTTALSKPCRFRLDTSTSATVTLSSGRKIGYAEYGVPATSGPKHVVFALHGLPGSRLEGAHVDQRCQDLGIRLILPERPAHGLSDPNPGWSILSHAQDVLSLAEHLGIERYGVIGTSGGGPYALGCAYLHPAEKLQSVTVLTGMGEAATMGFRGMAFMHVLGYSFGLRCGRAISHWPVTWIFRKQNPALTRIDLSDEERHVMMMGEIDNGIEKKQLHPKDIEVLTRDREFTEDMFRITIRSNRENWSTVEGCKAVVLDGANMAAPWGFNIQDIRADLPVQLWYGTCDSNCPASHGEQIEERLKLRGDGKGAETVKLHLKDETHLSLQQNYQKEVWDELIESMERSVETYNAL